MYYSQDDSPEEIDFRCQNHEPTQDYNNHPSTQATTDSFGATMKSSMHCSLSNRQSTGIMANLSFICLLILLILPNLNLCANTRMGHQRINHQEVTSSDKQDTGAQDTSDQASGDTSGPDFREDSLPPPNELSVIRLNDTSVVLRWDFPAEYQEHLQFFKVQYKSTRKDAQVKTDPNEILTTTRAYQINGLRPGNFVFNVIAVYDNDDNIMSEPFKFKIRARSKIKPEEMPEMTAPKIYWSEASNDFFRFKWSYEPKPNDTEYYGFLVYYRSIHMMTDFTIYNTLEASVEIAELDPDVSYQAKVVAYNKVAVSEFSETITIRTTSPTQNATSTISNNTLSTTSTTTLPPITTSTSVYLSTSTTSRPTPTWPTVTTQKPPVIVSQPTHNGTDILQYITLVFEPIFTDQSDTMTIARYSLMALVPLFFVVLLLIFLVKPLKKEPSPPPATDNSMQFHLEINGYFKNSFPGVEDEYVSMAGGKVHNGFVNPHIDEFT